MNRMSTVLAALGITAGLLGAPAASAAQHQENTKPAAPRHDPCTGEFQGDARLGPKWLPKKKEAPVGPLLNGYERTGDLSPADFLKKYWEGPADSGSWKYPPNDGFGEVNGELDKEPAKLRTGQRLDRFGSEYGSYLAPAGTRTPSARCPRRASTPATRPSPATTASTRSPSRSGSGRAASRRGSSSPAAVSRSSSTRSSSTRARGSG